MSAVVSMPERWARLKQSCVCASQGSRSGVAPPTVMRISEVMPSRGVRALEGEGKGLSHLEVIARGRSWRRLASRGIDRGAQRVNANPFAPIPSFCSSCDCKTRCHQSWTLIPTPIQVFMES